MRRIAQRTLWEDFQNFISGRRTWGFRLKEVVAVAMILLNPIIADKKGKYL
nr:MAG TPA: hypothetical protein [Caudoviricetes sp.]